LFPKRDAPLVGGDVHRVVMVHVAAGRVVMGGDDARGARVELHPVLHLRTGEWQRDVEAIAHAARNEMHVVMEDILPRRAPAVDDHVHPLRARHLANRGLELECDLEEMHRNLGRQIVERLEVSPRRDKYVAGVHRLDVHERDRYGILVADACFARPANELAERAVGGRRHWAPGQEERNS